MLSQVEQKRGSTRIVGAVPVTVRAVDALNQPFEENTKTSSISCHGCRYFSKHFVPRNTIINLGIPRTWPSGGPHWILAQVRWVARPRSVRELFQIAVRFEVPGDVWRITDRPDDWFPSPDAAIKVGILDENGTNRPDNDLHLGTAQIMSHIVGSVERKMPCVKPRYEVALSFAGEDRKYVARTAGILKSLGIETFYDEYEPATLWGRDLYIHLDGVYRIRSRYTVMFISRHYATKLWTNHERRSAQARAFTESKEYILPARFDDTEIPGLPPTVGYVDLRNIKPAQLARLIFKKLRSSQD